MTTHTYGAPPLDLRPILERYGRADIPIWWTEWGVSPTHGGPVNDSVWGAPLVARGMRSAAGRLDALAYWVASDQFVELGVPEQLFHGGFGLLTIGGLRKPRFWAIAVLERLGDEELASRRDRGRRRQPRRGVGEPGRGRRRRIAWRSRSGTARSIRPRPAATTALGRHVTLDVTGLPRGRVSGRAPSRRRRRTRTSPAPGRRWAAATGRRRANGSGSARPTELESLVPDERVRVGSDGVAHLAFDLPMPAISFVEIRPAS